MVPRVAISVFQMTLVMASLALAVSGQSPVQESTLGTTGLARLGPIVRVSADSDGTQASSSCTNSTISSDGSVVAFTASGHAFRPDAPIEMTPSYFANIVYTHEMASGLTDRLDVSIDGKVLTTGLICSAISSDGTLVASYAVQEMTPVESRVEDIIIFDRKSRAITRVDLRGHHIGAPLGPYPVAMASDGSCVVVQTTADFAHGITTASCWLFDVAAGTVESLPVGGAALSPTWPSVSADGHFIAFNHMPSTTDDTHPAGIYLLDRKAQTLVPMLDGAPKPGTMPHVSSDARFIVYESRGLGSDAEKPVPGVWIIDLASGVRECVSVGAGGEVADGGSSAGPGSTNVVSADGRFVAFNSAASNLVPDDTNGLRDIFVRDRASGTTVCVSLPADGTQADGESLWPSISADGHRVAFTSKATNLVPGDTNRVSDVFVREIAWDE